MRAHRRTLGPIVAVALWVALVGGGVAWSAESEFEDRPAGASVEEFGSPLSRAVEERVQMRTLFPNLKRALQRYPNFIAESELVLDFRTFMFPLRNTKGQDAYAWAAGGRFGGRTGWWKDRWQAGASVYSSFPIVADDPRALTELLRPNEKGFIVAGEAYVKGRFADNEITLGRQELDLPYVNKNDSRMAPNSFQGLVGKGVARGVPWLNRLDWVAGYLSHIRPRNESNFISMSEAAGARSKDRGMALAGLQFRPSRDMHLGAYNYYAIDTFNTLYASADYLHKISADWAMRYQIQYTRQTSVGQELVGSFDTWGAGVRAATSWRGWTAWLAFNQTSDEGAIQTPFGSYAGYVSLMQSDFDRAGERATNIGLSYAPKVIPEFSAFVQYGHGDGGLDVDSGISNAFEREVNATVDWRFEEGDWRGLWLRARASVLRSKNSETGWEVRLILNYVLPVL